MSRSCTAMSLKMPPPPRTYSTGGGDGSRDVSLTWTKGDGDAADWVCARIRVQMHYCTPDYTASSTL